MSGAPLIAGVELGGTKCICTLGRSPDDVRTQLAGLGYSNYNVVQKSGELHAIAIPDSN